MLCRKNISSHPLGPKKLHFYEVFFRKHVIKDTPVEEFTAAYFVTVGAEEKLGINVWCLGLAKHIFSFFFYR